MKLKTGFYNNRAIFCKTLQCSTWVLNNLTSFLWSTKVETKENCCRFVKYRLSQVLHKSQTVNL